jgi:chromatin segregation and condensation protein Rec8/ScpA/Scc1 (kleisin family)
MVTVKHQVVVTFLAILEMTRVKLIRLTQPEERGTIYISRAAEDLKRPVVEGDYK